MFSNPAAVARTAPVPIAPKRRPAASGEAGTTTGRAGSYGGGGGGTQHPESVDGVVDPCEACRKALAKCVLNDDDEDSSCVACQASGSDCSLVRSPQPRKRKLDDDSSEESNGRRSPPGGSFDGRRLQQQNSSLPSTVGSVSFLDEDVMMMASSGRGGGGGRGGRDGRGGGGRGSGRGGGGGPTLLSRTLGLQHDRYSQYIGPTTDFEPSLINLSPFDPHDESLLGRGTVRRVGPDATFLLLPDRGTPGHDHISHDVDEIERLVAPHGRRLIDLYFDVIHPAFPILEKAVFLEKYGRSAREFSPPLLAAVYILAINWWDHCDDLARLRRPDVRALERLVRTTLADAMYRPKLSTVQAGLLLSQRPEGDQWAPTAQLVAVGQELGLHLDCSGWKIPPWEKGLRRRLGWALYMQDKWGALVHGRTSHLFPADWAVRPLAEADFPDDDVDPAPADRDDDHGGGGGGAGSGADPDPDPDCDDPARHYYHPADHDARRGRAIFQFMVQLTCILAEILDTFYTLAAMRAVTEAGPRGPHLVLSLAKPIQLRLKEFHASLPATVLVDPYSGGSGAQSPLSCASTSAPARLSSVGYLNLAYFAAEMTLHRRIIRSLVEPGAAAGVDPGLHHICRSAAKARLISAMDFVNRLSARHLRSFWYFASKTNFALIGTFGSLLWATSPTRDEAEWYSRRLSEYRWTLGVSSKPAGSGGSGRGLTEFAMTMLDISTGLLKKLPEKPELGVVAAGGGGGAGIGIGIEAGTMFMSSLPPRPPPPPPPLSDTHSSPIASGHQTPRSMSEDDDDDDDDGSRDSDDDEADESESDRYVAANG